MIHCAADLRIRQLGNFTSTILRKTRAALTMGPKVQTRSCTARSLKDFRNDKDFCCERLIAESEDECLSLPGARHKTHGFGS